MKKHIKLLDSILIVLIVISVLQIIVDDLGIIYKWGDTFDFSMAVSGFAFDFIFSVEFIVRSISASRKKKFKEYFFHQRGWVDFLSSVPLLLLNSGPTLYMDLFGEHHLATRSLANLLKLIKAIRVTRVLRILRLLKIFGKIENAFSHMVLHHVSVISSITVVTSVVVFIALHYVGIFNTGDVVEEARLSLALTTLLIANVCAYTFIYAAQFAQSVTDPIYVMKRGFTEEKYNFSVHIKKYREQDEVFELAEKYNKIWLPLKSKVIDAYHKKEQKQESAKEDFSDLL